jgi:hypothetical protein
MAVGTFMCLSSIVADITNSKKNPDSRQEALTLRYNSCLHAFGGDRDGRVVF